MFPERLCLRFKAHNLGKAIEMFIRRGWQPADRLTTLLRLDLSVKATPLPFECHGHEELLGPPRHHPSCPR